MEIERKWLINIEDVPFDLEKSDYLDIEQSYISFKPTVRIRRIVNKGEYILTIKSSSKDNGLSRQEYEINISKEEYDNLLKKIEGIVLKKRRYRVLNDGYLFEIDKFLDEYDGLAYMEIEFKTKEEALAYKQPNWVLNELTSVPSFSNATLAKQKYTKEELLKILKEK